MLFIEDSRPLRQREREILLAHPLFFRAVRDPVPYRFPIGFWGLEVSDGWLEIVSDAADRIETAIAADITTFDFVAHINLLDRQQLQYLVPPNEEDVHEGDGEHLMNKLFDYLMPCHEDLPAFRSTP